MNVIASSELVAAMIRAGNAIDIVIFAAGRPAYLSAESDPSLTEGKVMAQHFIRRSGSAIGKMEMVTLSQNQDTFDDIETTIALAAEKQVDTVGMITVKVHIPRTMEFARRSVWHGRPVQLIFIAAEDLLARRYRARLRVASSIMHLVDTPAYRRSALREERGILALRAGTYGRSVAGTNNRAISNSCSDSN